MGYVSRVSTIIGTCGGPCVFDYVCDSDYDLAVMGTLALAWVWALGLVPEVPELGQMISLLWSDMCWCLSGYML